MTMDYQTAAIIGLGLALLAAIVGGVVVLLKFRKAVNDLKAGLEQERSSLALLATDLTSLSAAVTRISAGLQPPIAKA